MHGNKFLKNSKHQFQLLDLYLESKVCHKNDIQTSETYNNRLL